MKSYTDQFLNSLLAAYRTNPSDLAFKKYFGFELYKKGELQDALVLLQEIFETDKDIQIEKALLDIRSKLVTEGDQPYQIDEEDQTPKPSITFADVAGMEEIKDAIRTDIIYPFQHPEIYKMYGNKSGGGILLFGPPGCGKTFIAKATAGEINAKFYNSSVHELLSRYLGEGEHTLHALFEQARETKPSVLFFDEIDAVGMHRDKSSGALRTMVNQFLTELDGIESNNDGVLVMAATNLPWDVDLALRRPGRFDKMLFVGPPDLKARKRLFELELDGKPHEDIHIDELAAKTKRFSGADIAHVCDGAADQAFKEAIKTGKVVPLTHSMLLSHIESTQTSTSDWFSTVKNYIKYSNESGFYNLVKEYLDKHHDE